MNCHLDMFSYPKPCPSWLPLAATLNQLYPELTLRQVCSYHWAENPEQYQAIWVPAGRAPGYQKKKYKSYIVTRDEPLPKTDLRLGYNQRQSFSGDIVINSWSRQLREKPEQIQTGSHKASLDALLTKQIDVASIDALSFWFTQLICPEVKELRILAWAENIPAHPIVAVKPSTGLVSDLSSLKRETHRQRLLNSIQNLPLVDFLIPRDEDREFFKKPIQFQEAPHQNLLYGDLLG